MKTLIFFFISYLSAVCSLNGNRVLVLLDSLSSRDSYSLFFDSFTERGYALTYRTADDSSNALRKNGDNIYDHLILFCPSVEEFGGELRVDDITNFIDNGGNVLVAANSNIGDPLRQLALENGMEYDQPNTSVLDHMHYDAHDLGKHTTLWLGRENVIDSDIIVGKVKAPILFNGIGLLKDPKNELVIDILTAHDTSFTNNADAKQVTDYPHASGNGLSLVAALQALNNARVVFSGSIDLFSNQYFISPVIDALTGKDFGPSGNKEFAIALSRWVFKESGVLRAGEVSHVKKGDINKNPLSYTVTDDVVYDIVIETMDDKGKWVPYVAKDIQLEFVRIDPFIRTDLTFKDRKYTTTIKLPDVYGVYQFKVDYLRKGYTHLFVSKQVSVRPFQHTQYERFISSAYPYYASAFLMMLMFYALTFVVLYHKEEPSKTKSE